MKPTIDTVEEYLAQIDDNRREVFLKLRETVCQNIPEGFQETVSYGMVGYVVPFSIYPEGYHCDPKLPLPFVSIAAQKNFIALYHMGMYADQDLLDWFVSTYEKQTGKKPDMGKSCVRFKNGKPIPFGLIAELMEKVSVDKWIGLYCSNLKR